MTSNFYLLAQTKELEFQLTTINLGPLIAESALLRHELGIARWSFFKAGCNGEQPPKNFDPNGLKLWLERLSVRWADG